MDKITTNHVFPPIPMRQFDWAAYRDPEGRVGWGRTEAEAIAELKELEDGVVPDRESFWLVERKCQPPQYVQDRSELPGFTDDAWRALRFNTEREAFDFRLRMATMRDECFEVEHVFINKR